MHYREVLALIEEGEGFDIEFKRRVPSPEKIARTLVAFANTKGGHILFGVDDDGSIVGVESEKSEVNQILEAGSVHCQPEIVPAIDIVPFSGRDVIVAYVSESSEKPHVFSGPTNGTDSPETKVFIRVNDKTVLASREVAKVLRDERPDAPPMRITIGENERRLFRHLEEHERITVAEFSHMVNISERRATRVLVALVRAGVIRIHTMEKSNYFTLAYDGVADSA